MRRLTVLLLLACSSSQSNEDCVAVGRQARTFAENKLGQWVQGCTTSADCVLMRAALSCYSGCERAIVKGREGSAGADLSALDDSICSGSACSVNDGCAPVHAECQVGRCITVSGAFDAGTRDGGSADGG